MGRVITDERRAQIKAAREASPDALGPALAELIIAGNVPVEGVAAVLAVSEPTIYRWMYGQAEPRDSEKILRVRRLLAVLRRAKKEKDTPLEGSTPVRVVALVTLIKSHRDRLVAK
jgi:hypothetical protein